MRQAAMLNDLFNAERVKVCNENFITSSDKLHLRN